MGSSSKASQAASGEQGSLQSVLNQLESYTGQQQQAERGAIAGIGANPYFAAGQKMNPDAYRMNPGQTQTFGSSGPGTYLANVNAITSGGAPAPWRPPVDGPGGGPGGGSGSGGGPGKPPEKNPYPPGGGIPGGGGGGGYGGSQGPGNSGYKGHEQG